VAGLVTGGDLIEQLKGMELGDRLLIPDTMLRNGEEVFLDDVRLDDVRDTLHVPVNIVESNGGSLLAAFLGCTRKREESFPGYEPEEIYYG
jgi:NifB/MoaA-like Fe-S oxidoreductase